MRSHTHRYTDTAAEPDSSDREIVFTVFDGEFSGNDSLTLEIETIDDNPTVVCMRALYQQEWRLFCGGRI